MAVVDRQEHGSLGGSDSIKDREGPVSPGALFWHGEDGETGGSRGRGALLRRVCL